VALSTGVPDNRSDSDWECAEEAIVTMSYTSYSATGAARVTRSVRGFAMFALWLALATVATPAQSPSSEENNRDASRPRAQAEQPLYLQADQLIYDTKSNRVIAQGNVEIYYNNFILTADQVIYQKDLNKLTAEGNAQLKDPNGNITRADRLEAPSDLRDAFARSLSPGAPRRD
jgi:lipopolysaccharide assembly outer membrane protein LptD (OstA)